MNKSIFNTMKFTYANRKLIINDLMKNYKFLSSGMIGRSLCGRSIDFIKIGNQNNANLWVAAHHGMEWITSAIVLRFLREICEKIKNKQEFCGINFEKILEKKGLVIIPCLNPDGVEVSIQGSAAGMKYSRFIELSSKGKSKFWQANARGVDLNHNYSAGWKELHELEVKSGITKPCSTRYGGMRPLSEPETISIVNFCKRNNFSSAIAFHSQGEEIYWDFGPSTPKESEKMAGILALSSGYSVSKPEGLAVGGGFKDWFIENFRRPAFTLEIGKGQNPLAISESEKIYEKIEKMLYLSLIV